MYEHCPVIFTLSGDKYSHGPIVRILNIQQNGVNLTLRMEIKESFIREVYQIINYYYSSIYDRTLKC